MLRSCKYCGRIHPKGYICPKKPKQAPHRNGKVAGFRKTYAWQRKRNQIVRRDFYLCRVCNEGSYEVFGVPGLEQDLSVHHIEPLEERFDLRLDDSNLLTCCGRHHRMADDGDIPRDYLHDLAETSPPMGLRSASAPASRPTAAPWARQILEMGNRPAAGDAAAGLTANLERRQHGGKTQQISSGEDRRNRRR